MVFGFFSLHTGDSSMWVFTTACLIALTGKHVSSECPVISPPVAAVRFGDPLWANCTALTEQVRGMGWESSLGGTPITAGVRSLALNIESVTDWRLSPICFINSLDGNQCMLTLQVTVYKTPDKVSMSGPAGPLIQDQKYEMRCDVFNVAPVKKLLVRWYKGNTIVSTEIFDDQTVYPVNTSSVFTLLADRDDHGSLIWCEAAMTFWIGTDRPANRSEAYKTEVLFPPAFTNATDVELELRDRSPLLLNCTASGNPAPAYSWRFPDPIQLTFMNETTNRPVLMPVLQLPGVYTCMVWNSQGSVSKAFTVIEPERDRTTFAAIAGGFLAVGALLALAGLYFVTPSGTFAFNQSGYQRGQPTSSGPV